MNSSPRENCEKPGVFDAASLISMMLLAFPPRSLSVNFILLLREVYFDSPSVGIIQLRLSCRIAFVISFFFFFFA